MGLGFGFILVTLIAFILFWAIVKPRFILLSFLPMLIGWKSISVFFAFHFSPRFDYTKAPNTLRIAHWNVARFVELKRNNNKGSQTRLKMMDQIKEQNADILCMQEFFTSTDPQYYNNINHVMKELGYPYFYYSNDLDGPQQYMGQAIFSRLPIIDSGMIRYPKPAADESLIHADVIFNNDTVRLYTTHLQSVHFEKADYEGIEKIKNTDDGMVKSSKNVFAKLKRGLIYRSGQAKVVKDEVSKSPHPFVLTGDFNDVPNSFAYFTIKGNDLNDAFLSTGLGVGRTFSGISPTLRIDYIFTTPDIKVKQYNRVMKTYSDHYMLVVDITL